MILVAGSGVSRQVALAAVILVALGWATPAVAKSSRGHHARGQAAAHHRPGAPPDPEAADKRAQVEPAEAEQLEQVEAVEAVEAEPAGGAPAAGSGRLSAQQLVAHLHPALVHLPIAWLMLWLLAEMVSGRLLALGGAVGPLAWACTASFLPATLTGLLHVAELPQDPASLGPVLLHRNLMLAAGAACLALAGWRQLRPQVGGGRSLQRRAYLGALALTLLAVATAAHWGGQLVYGEDYLPF